MRKGLVELIIRAKDLASGVVKNFEKNLRSSVQLVRNVGRDLAAIGAGAAGVVLGLQRMGKAGAEVIGVKRAFARVTGDEVGALQKLRDASRGTISDLDLMRASNQAMALGAARTAEDVATLVRQSRALGRALGIDGAEALEKYTVALARQSKLRLDDLGITLDASEANERYAESIGKSVDKLTDAEKAEAFRTEAMRRADELILKLGESHLKGAEAAERFGAMVANLKDRLTELVANSPRVAALFDGLSLLAQDLSGDDVALAAVRTSIARIDDLDVLIDRFNDVAAEADRVREKIAQAESMPLSNSVESQARIRKLREELRLLRGEAEIVGRRLTVVASGGLGGGGDDEGGGEAGPARGPALRGAEDMAGLLDAIRNAEAALEKAQFAEKIAEPGEKAEEAAAKVEELAQQLANLQALAAPYGGVPGLILGTSRIPAPSDGLLSPQGIADPAAAFRSKRYSLAPDFVAGTERGLPFGDSLRISPRGAASEAYSKSLKDAEGKFADTAGVVASTMGDVAADVIRGTATVSSAVTSMIGNILQRVAGPGLLGGVLGGVFAIGSALLSRSNRDPVRVSISDVESRAERKMKGDQRPVRQTIIIEQNGVPIEEIERELYDRQTRDEVVRFPVGSSGLR